MLLFFYAILPCCIAFVLVSAMARTRPRGLTFFRTVLFLPQVVAMVAVAVAWQWIYSEHGPINGTLRLAGLGGLARGWLGDFDLGAAVRRADRHVGGDRAGHGAVPGRRAEDPP